MAKKKKKKDGKKAKASANGGSAAAAKISGAGKRLKALTENPLVADVVAAALVATAAALKDSKKARQLAEQAGDELAKLEKAGSERGSALWQLALEIGRRTVDTIVGEAPAEQKKKKPAKPKGKSAGGGDSGTRSRKAATPSTAKA